MSDRGAVLAANIAALAPEAADLVSEPPGSGWALEWTSPWPSLTIASDAGHPIALASRRAPLDEARVQLAAALGGDPWPPLVVLLGAGLGYAVDIVEQDAPPETRVLVVEPFPEAAHAMLSRRDWTMLASRLDVLVGPSYRGAAEAWRAIPAGARHVTVVHPVLARVRPRELAGAHRVLERVLFDATANANARETLGGVYLQNTLRNLARVASAPSLAAWEGTAAGRPAVVCGAGPSLNDNIEALRPYRAGLVLVAADTAYRPLAEAGLAPDFVVALDPAPLNARHLAGVTAPPTTWLVAEASLDPSALEGFDDRVAFFRVGPNDPWPWLLAHGFDLPVLPAWGSVVTSAFGLARLLGSDPIAFAGLDLAFTGGQPYCRGTIFETDWARGVLGGRTLAQVWARATSRWPKTLVLDAHGEAVNSAPHLVAFRDWLVEYVAGTGVRVWNVTGAGILGGAGIEQVAPEKLRSAAVRATYAHPITPGTQDRVGRGSSAAGGRQSLAPVRAALLHDRAQMDRWTSEYAGIDVPVLERALAPSELVAIPRRRSPGESHGGSLSGLPEAVAIIRAVRDGGPPPEWAASRHPARGAREAAPLASLIDRGRLDVRGATRIPRSIGGHLQWLSELEWPAEVIDRAAAVIIDAGDRLRHAQPGATLRQELRTTSEQMLERPFTARAAERRARTMLMAATAAADAAEGAAQQVLRAIDATAVALDSAPSPASSRLTLRATDSRSCRAWRIAAALPPERLGHALRGVLLGPLTKRPRLGYERDGIAIEISWATGAGNGEALQREVIALPRVTRLASSGLPRCLGLTAADGYAVATPRGERASVRIEQDGAWTTLPAWPEPIVFEAHAPEGQVACTAAVPCTLMFRPTPGGPVVSHAVPFQPYSVAWHHGEIVLSTSRGVWAWSPGTAPRQVAPLDPGLLVSFDEGRACVDPLALAANRPEKRRLASGWTVNLATGRVDARALPAIGQAWSEHAAAGRTATSFTVADVVRIADATRERWLVWPSPRSVVWLGSSLLLNDGTGEVTLVPGAIEASSR